MPRIYLSPSTQEYNLYHGGGNEEYYMNLIADALVPWLLANSIRYTRNTPDMTAASSIQQSKESTYDFYLSLHSNAAPEGKEGTLRGAEVYYSPRSRNGRRAAEIIAANLREIYPYPEWVRTVPTLRLGEVTKTIPPAALIEFAYHDNEEDADWIRENIQPIAVNVAQSMAEYFFLPFSQAVSPQIGTVATAWGNLNLRQRPFSDARIIGRLPKGSPVTVYGKWEGWYTVKAGGQLGYVSAAYVELAEPLVNL